MPVFLQGEILITAKLLRNQFEQAAVEFYLHDSLPCTYHTVSRTGSDIEPSIRFRGVFCLVV